MDLRPYQIETVEAAMQHKKPLVVLPTGAGKTVVAAEIIRRAENKHVLFLAHRRELIHQACDKLAAFDIKVGTILAGEKLNHMRRVQIASVQTLWSRCFRRNNDLPPAGIVVIDEAHHVPARTYQKIVEQYPDAQIFGLTATPCRKDGRGLGGTFDHLVEGPQVEQLIADGHLVRTRVFAPSAPDLKGVQTRGGDYVVKQLERRVDLPQLVGDIVTHWHRLAERRKTVCFATSVAHSIHIKDEFVESGVRAEHIDGKTPKDERDEILARLSRGDLELVTNCMVLTEGWDQPDVSCAIMARPTKSAGLYRQMMGRILRPAEGKTDALILDHAGAVFQHGFVEDPVIWTLDPDLKAETPAQEARSAHAERELLTCSECSAVRTAGKPCPECGFMPKRPGEYLHVRDGDLARVERDGTCHPHHYTEGECKTFYAELAWIAAQRGYKPGWAKHKFRERFGHWPNYRSIIPQEPSPEVLAWVRHCQIKYAKRMQKAASND